MPSDSTEEHIKGSILVPAWNEEARLPGFLEKIIDYLKREKDTSWEIIVCADGSTDRTLRIIDEYAQKYPQIKAAYWPERLGKGGGILHGLKFVRGEVVVIIDVDLPTPPDQIPKLASLISSGVADLVLGSRNLKGSIITEKTPILRKFLGRSFNFFFRQLFDANFHDTQCGFKAIKTIAFRDLSEDLQIDGYAFDIDLIIKAIKKVYRVIEVPIVWGHRKGSKVNIIHQIFEMADSLLIVWLENQKRDPRISTNERAMKSFYDLVPGDTYYHAERSIFLPRRLWHRTKNRLIEKNVGKDTRILEVGCGSGTIVERLLVSRSIYAIDLGKDFVKFCQSRYKDVENCHFVLADAQYVPFGKGAFDYVICSEVLEHISSPTTALKEFYNVLRPEGRLVLTTPNISVRWSFIEALWTRIRWRMIETGHTAFTEQRARYLLTISGFRILKQSKILLGCILFFIAEK